MYKSVAYLTDFRNYRKQNIKGFLNKSLFIISEYTDLAVPAWKAGELFDEKMHKAGIVICCDKNRSDREKLVNAVIQVCEKNEIKVVASGEMSDVFENAPDFAGMHFFTGGDARFVYGFEKAFENGELCEGSETLVLVSASSPENRLKYIADRMKYVTLYSADREALKRAERIFYEHNSTAVTLTQSISYIKEFNFAAVLDEKCYALLKNILKAKTVIGSFNVQTPNMVMYTDRLGKLETDVSFAEACMYVNCKIPPKDNLAELYEIINRRFWY